MEALNFKVSSGPPICSFGRDGADNNIWELLSSNNTLLSDFSRSGHILASHGLWDIQSSKFLSNKGSEICSPALVGCLAKELISYELDAEDMVLYGVLKSIGWEPTKKTIIFKYGRRSPKQEVEKSDTEVSPEKKQNTPNKMISKEALHFRAVRIKPWGKYAIEIRDSHRGGIRVWFGGTVNIVSGKPHCHWIGGHTKDSLRLRGKASM